MNATLRTADHRPRWLQRLEYYEKAFLNLQVVLQETTRRELSDIEQDGLIKRFEITYELSWKVLKDVLEHMGGYEAQGSQDAFRNAYTAKFLTSEASHALLAMKQYRNTTVHEYMPTNAEMITRIQESYYHAFAELYTALTAYREKHAEEVPL